MSELLKSLDDKRKMALAQAREIAERGAAGQERAEDEEAYVRANADYDKYSAQIKDELRHVKEEAETAEAFEATIRKAGVREHTDEEREAESGWLSDVRKSLSDKAARKSGGDQRLSDLRSIVRPEARTSTLTTGASTVPVTLADSLFRKLFWDSTILSSGVRIFRTSGGEQMKFPRLTGLGALSTQTKARVAEGGTIQKDADPAFDQVVFDAYKYAQIMQADREFIQDSVIDVEALLGEVLGRNMANYVGLDLTTGSGSGQPNGVVTCIPAGQQVTGPTTASQTGAPAITGFTNTADTLLDVVWKLMPAYRKQAKWLVNDTTVLAIRKMKAPMFSGDPMHYVFEPARTADGFDTLLGYPLLTDPNISAIGVGNISAIFGEMSMYWVRMVADIRVEWSTEYAWDTDLVSVKAVMRLDGDTIDNTAFAALKGAAS